MSKLKELTDQYTAKLKELRDLAAKAEGENRDFTADERQEVIRRTEELTALKSQINDAKGDDELRKAVAQLGDEIGLNDDGDGGSGRKTRDGARPGRGKSLGEQFVNAPEFKAWMGQFPNGVIPQGAKGLMSPPVQFKDVLTGASDTSGGAFVQTDYTGIYEALGRRPLTLRDLVSVRETGSDTVEYVRQTSGSNAAAPVPEATSADPIDGTTVTDEDGGLKPESSMAFQKVTESVKTIAVWVPATKRSLSDAAQLRGLIDDELRGDLEQELEDQILNGDGTGENFPGIANTSGTQSQAWDTDLFTTTRKALTKVRVVGRSMPTAFLLSPADDERFDLATDANDRFFGNGPFSIGPSSLWGVPRVVSEAVPEGTGFVGDFRKAVLWDREQASIQVSDSHADFFVRNLVAVLAEMRAAFGVIRPTAFVEIDLTAA